VVEAVMNGQKTLVRKTSSDMWSVGVTFFELAAKRPLFKEGTPPQEVAATLCMPGELELPGLQNVDENVRRLIEKLLVKDPEYRWSAGRCLQAKLFRTMDNTTMMAGSARVVAQQLRTQSEQIETVIGARLRAAVGLPVRRGRRWRDAAADRRAGGR
jgi:serine/threonine protein kinase